MNGLESVTLWSVDLRLPECRGYGRGEIELLTHATYGVAHVAESGDPGVRRDLLPHGVHGSKVRVDTCDQHEVQHTHPDSWGRVPSLDEHLQQDSLQPAISDP